MKIINLLNEFINKNGFYYENELNKYRVKIQVIKNQ